MRVLVLVTEAHGGYGGIAQYNQDLIDALAVYPGKPELVVVPRLQSIPFSLLPVNVRYITSAVNNKLKYVSALLTVAMPPNRYDLIICGHVNLLPIAFFVRLWLRAPIILVVYGIDVWRPTSSKLVNLLVRKISAFISISDFTRKKFLSWARLGNAKSFLLPNSIKTQRFSSGDKNKKLVERYHLEGKNVLMTLGRLSADERYKGVDEILMLLPDLVNENPNIIYMIVGDGSDRMRLEEKAAHLGIRKFVLFTGRIAENEKADHYRLADVYVMPSRGEGFGFVFLEAMACGIPVIASKIDGSREALRYGELGQLVDPDNPNEIKMAILKALKEERGKIPQGLEYFSYANFTRRLHDLLEEFLPQETSHR